jgi:hypothetical protein
VLTFEVGGASGVAQAVADRLPENTSQTARELYRVLVIVAIEQTRRLGRSAQTTEAVMHLPVELVAAAAEVSRTSAWRHLAELRALGVVDNRAHKASCRGQTRNSGTVWRVRLSPLRGSRARVSADDLRHKWRGQEIRGAASYTVLKHTKELQEQSLKIEIAIQWAVNPNSQQNPVTPVCSSSLKARLEAVLDVRHADMGARGGAVDLAAQALAQALRDSSSVNYYRRLLWQLLRRFDATGDDFSYQVYLAAQRARTDATEGFARKPGALFLSRLKKASWFAEMMSGPPVRVGTRPLEA